MKAGVRHEQVVKIVSPAAVERGFEGAPERAGRARRARGERISGTTLVRDDDPRDDMSPKSVFKAIA